MTAAPRPGHGAIRAAFVAVCALILAWTAVMSALEPVMLDGWFITGFHGSAADYVHANWSGELFWGNARLGQYVTVFTYAGAFHLIFTPLCVLAVFVLLLVHLRGRWPNAGDAWALLILLGVSILAQPQLGPVLFYRPFTANYVVGLVVQLVWLVPYRFALARAPVRGSSGRELAAALGMLVLGAAAGACNEHTGPVLILATAIIAIRGARRRQLRAWMIAGVLGAVAGYLALMLSPAQSTRYCGIVELSVFERIAERGFVGNAELVLAMVWAGRWAWLALVIAAVALRRRPVRGREAAAWLGLGLAISWTLLASPKQGDRLLFAPLAFATIGITLVLEDLAADRAGVRRIFGGLAGVIVAGAIVWSVMIQVRVAHDYDDRLQRLAAAPRGSVVRLPMLRDDASRWFIGDDLPSDAHRNHVAQRYGLEAIELDGHPTIPFQLEVRYQLAGGPMQLERRFLPLHLCDARRDFEHDVAELRQTHGGRLAGAELVVSTRTPVLDGRPLAASRWHDGRVVAPSASVIYEDHARWISIARGGITGPLDVILIGPGRVEHLTQDGERWRYQPWTRGMYWIVACATDGCFLVDTVRHIRV